MNQIVCILIILKQNVSYSQTGKVFYTDSFMTYYGRSLAVVRAGEARVVKVSATDGDLTGVAEIVIE